MEESGFGKDTTSWVFPNYSKINACLTLKFMYLKARLLVSFHTAGTFWLSCHGQTIFNIVIFGYLCQFSWFIFIVSHCVCNVRVRSFFCSVFFQIRKSHYLCTLYIRIACLIYLKNKWNYVRRALEEISHRYANLVLPSKISKWLAPSITANL